MKLLILAAVFGAWQTEYKLYRQCDANGCRLVQVPTQVWVPDTAVPSAAVPTSLPLVRPRGGSSPFPTIGPPAPKSTPALESDISFKFY